MATRLALSALALLMVLALAACGEEEDQDRELVVMSHDSFNIGEDVIAAFEAANDATVVLQPAGDTGLALNRAILEKGNPSADLFYGVDNTYLGRALAEGIFEKYESDNISFVPDHLILDPDFYVTPIDYGYVNLNYDKAYLEENGLNPPTSLEELAGPDWKGRLVVENPATSSPGLAFLIATVSYFGEDDDYDYLDFWADLRANDVAVTDGWSDAYYTNFSVYGGDRPAGRELRDQPRSGVPLRRPSGGGAAHGQHPLRPFDVPADRGHGHTEGRQQPQPGAEVHRLCAGAAVPGGLPGQDVCVPCEPERAASGLLALCGGAGRAREHLAQGDRGEARGGG